jgi:hypothetical protein
MKSLPLLRRDDGRVAGAPLAALGSGRHFAGVSAKMSAASLGMISMGRSRGSQKRSGRNGRASPAILCRRKNLRRSILCQTCFRNSAATPNEGRPCSRARIFRSNSLASAMMFPLRAHALLASDPIAAAIDEEGTERAEDTEAARSDLG